jgi:alkylation response protein AidB-like acyl-CoA dehydrogenase
MPEELRKGVHFQENRVDGKTHDNRPPADPSCLDETVAALARADGPADEAGTWPDRLWEIVDNAGATRWSLPKRLGGDECDRRTIIGRYARLTEGSLTASFILTQHDASVRRLLGGSPHSTADRWLERIAAGEVFTTVGISHLTTSRRYGPQAVLATELPGGRYRLDGMVPWVTGAPHAQMIVTGATLEDGRQMLIALPTDLPGATVRPPFVLAALQASCTAEIACEGVEIESADVIAGPIADVMAMPGAASTGGLETSALALGQARAALRALEAEAPQREALAEPVEALAEEWSARWSDLLAAARGDANAPPATQIRRQANALALRTTQAYLTARKGTGFLRADPASRWARQALFFLVWSCPGPVAQAAIRDLAGLCAG